MIRYPLALTGIETAVTSEVATWLTRAEARTTFFTRHSGYTEEYCDAKGKKRKLSPFWGEVKQVYMRRQHNKCVYCETKLEGGQYGKVQWDLEHFRPKGNVRKWPIVTSFPTGDDWPSGYYLLAYHLYNYAVSCQSCNRSFKSDFFPIASARIAGKLDPADYMAEEAFLVYPLGISDEDPENLLTFDGATVIPKQLARQDAPRWRRGQVIIDFFALNRDPLKYSRASWLLRTVWPNIQLARQENIEAKSNVNWLCSELAPFTHCARCFVALCDTDLPTAKNMLLDFKAIVTDMEGS